MGNTNAAGATKTEYGQSDIMVASFKCDGTLRWTKLIGGSREDRPYQLRVDKKNGVYITGHLDLSGSTIGHIDADVTLSSTNKTVYLIKYDTAGNYQWYRTPQADTVTIAGFTPTYSIDIDVDADGNLHWLCRLPPGVFGGSFVTPILADYMLKYSSNGGFQGGFKLDVILGGSSAGFTEMVRDHNNQRYYLSGYWNDITDFAKVGNVTLTGSMFVICFDKEGRVIWYRQNTDDNSSAPGFSGRPALDEKGNIYVTGWGMSASPSTGISATIFNGFTVATPAPYYGGPVVIALDSSGKNLWGMNAYVDASVGSANIAVRNSGEVIISGSFPRYLKWPGYAPYFNHPPNSPYITFITRLNTQTGQVLGMDTIHESMNSNYPTAIAADGRNNVYVGGQFKGNPKINGVPLNFTGGATDWYIAKYGHNNCNCTNIPEPKFNFSRTSDTGVAFTYTGTNYSNITWNFGDGKTSTQASPSHSYDSTGFYTACVTVSNSCGDNTYCAYLALWPTGVKDINAERDIKIYPNPVMELLTISGAAPKTNVAVYDMVGQQVYNGIIQNSKETISTSNLPAGNYILQLTTPEGSRRNLKFIKQ